MMHTFKGFQIEEEKFSGIPEDFFRFVLPEIREIDILKIVLYVLWKADKVGDYGISFTIDELKLDRIFIDGLASEDHSDQYLQALLKKTVNSGLLLCQHDNKPKPVYYLNCEAGKKNLADAHDNGANLTLDQIKPNIFKIYEENIGPLTPLIADALREAEALYDNKWITEAIEIAIKQNARSWRYVEKILERWKKEGRDGTDRKHDQTDYRRYIKG